MAHIGVFRKGVIMSEQSQEFPNMVRVQQQLRLVRETGMVNMISANEVQGVANVLNAHDLVIWIEEHRRGTRRVDGWVELLNEAFREG